MVIHTLKILQQRTKGLNKVDIEMKMSVDNNSWCVFNIQQEML